MISSLHSGVTKVIRSSGQVLDSIGKKFEINAHTDKLIPSTKVVKLGKNVPVVDGAFIASSATVVGKVNIAKGASIWYGAVLRGDESTITVGENSTIGDRVMVHCSTYPKEAHTVIGKNVVVNAGAILHGCLLEDGAVVGEGAQVMDGAKVGKSAFVAPGSLLATGKVVPAGQLWSGAPARFVRNLTEAEMAQMGAVALENVTLALEHAAEGAKSWQTIEQEEYDHNQLIGRASYYHRRQTDAELSERLGEIENHEIPGRILNSHVSAVDHRPKN